MSRMKREPSDTNSNLSILLILSILSDSAFITLTIQLC
jgi:hypothetical protein